MTCVDPSARHLPNEIATIKQMAGNGLDRVLPRDLRRRPARPS
jgi:hypothetical protein